MLKRYSLDERMEKLWEIISELDEDLKDEQVRELINIILKWKFMFGRLRVNNCKNSNKKRRGTKWTIK